MWVYDSGTDADPAWGAAAPATGLPPGLESWHGCFSGGQALVARRANVVIALEYVDPVAHQAGATIAAALRSLPPLDPDAGTSWRPPPEWRSGQHQQR